MSTRVAVVVNPTSGLGRGAAAATTVTSVLRAAGHGVDEIVAPSATEAADRADRAVQAGVDALVVVGGDGVVNLGIGAVAGTSVPLGVVAAGSGNDIARVLDLPLADAEAAVAVVNDALADPERASGRAVDAVRWSADGAQGWFGSVLAAGFDAIVNERANRLAWPRGPARYTVAIARELPLFRPRPYRITLDGRLLETEAMLVAVANASTYGGGMRVAPDALVDDGLLDVVVVGPMSVPRFVRLYPSVYAGRHVHDPRVQVLRGRRVHVEVPRSDVVAYADGERLAPLPVTCEVVPGALRVLAPPSLT